MNYIVWIQVLPHYFNQSWAISVGYQILIALSTNFIGYGLAGLCRHFLVYPTYCIWPESLVTIALNSAFHDAPSENDAVPGPFRSTWTMSRLRFFIWAFGLMFAYFWLPNYLFGALSYFSWMTWIAPGNRDLANISGVSTGLGLNPLPTFDWNILTFIVDPLIVPFFSTINLFLGAFVSMFVILAIFYTNTYYTSYLPINSNLPYDHFGKPYNVTSVLNENAVFEGAKYEAYSPPFLSASKIVVYMLSFGVYTAAVTYAILYHRRQMILAVRGVFAGFWRRKKRDFVNEPAENDDLDIHSRLMAFYKEVPEWWYMICLVIATALGIAGMAGWPTNTTLAVVFCGVGMCLIFVVPTGIIKATTGVDVGLNVLSEFIGGVWAEGNAIAMCYFKSYGYVTCAQALSFAGDLKLAHYLKIAPHFTFFAQMVPTLVSTFVSVAVMQYQVRIENICTPNAPFRFTCPGINTFTATVL